MNHSSIECIMECCRCSVLCFWKFQRVLRVPGLLVCRYDFTVLYWISNRRYRCVDVLFLCWRYNWMCQKMMRHLHRNRWVQNLCIVLFLWWYVLIYYLSRNSQPNHQWGTSLHMWPHWESDSVSRRKPRGRHSLRLLSEIVEEWREPLLELFKPLRKSSSLLVLKDWTIQICFFQTPIFVTMGPFPVRYTFLTACMRARRWSSVLSFIFCEGS